MQKNGTFHQIQWDRIFKKKQQGVGNSACVVYQFTPGHVT